MDLNIEDENGWGDDEIIIDDDQYEVKDPRPNLQPAFADLNAADSNPPFDNNVQKFSEELDFLS